MRDDRPGDFRRSCPEVLLFFKATAYLGEEQYDEREETDEQDFLALAPLLAPGTRSWLHTSVARVCGPANIRGAPGPIQT